MAPPTLLQYLMKSPGAPAPYPDSSEGLTKSGHFHWNDIKSWDLWKEPSLDTIVSEHKQVLMSTIPAEHPPVPVPGIVPKRIQKEDGVVDNVARHLLNPLEKALKHACSWLTGHGYTNITPVDFDAAITLAVPGGYPDRGFVTSSGSKARIRCEYKPSYKWNSGMRESAKEQYRQGLAQLNYYMKENQTRYGFMLTDQELVAVKRMDRDGNLQVARSVRWGTSGSYGPAVMTVLLAFWKMGMLSATGDGWYMY